MRETIVPDLFHANAPSKKHEPIRSASLSLLLITALVLQNSISALLGRATRTRATLDELYSIDHFIITSECAKFLLSASLEIYFQGSFAGLCHSINTHIIQKPLDAIKGSLVPASLYLVSNTLQYVALSNLSVPVFQVIYQCRLVITAVVSVIMLKKSYSVQQWFCITAVSVGVAVVAIGEEQKKYNEEASAADQNQNPYLGIFAIAVACVFSALAGVYLEKILKQEQRKEESKYTANVVSTIYQGQGQCLVSIQPPSLWIRNLMLAFFSVLICVVQGKMQNNETTQHNSRKLFHGFTVLVWIQVLLFACGGLLAAGVIKYADNVIKGLATGLSVALSAALSISFLGTPFTAEFVAGLFLILLFVFLFNYPIHVKCEKPSYNTVHAWGTAFIYGMISIFSLWNFYSLHLYNEKWSSSIPLHNSSTKEIRPVSKEMRPVSKKWSSSIPLYNSSTKEMPPVSKIRFYVRTVPPSGDCGGCMVLDLLRPAIQDLGYTASSNINCPVIRPDDDSAVIIYPEVATARCPGGKKTLHVHWMLAPIGVHIDQTTALRWWNEDDFVFHYGTNSQNTTKIPVPLSNILMLARNPSPGDDTDPIVISRLKPPTQRSIAYILRKATRFHGPSLYSPDGKLPHQTLGLHADFLQHVGNGIETSKAIMQYKYFISYDPYSFWSMKAAMLGVVSVVHPVEGLTKEQWINGFYIGAYLREHGLPLTIPGIAYGWNEFELDYARKTLHEMRPLLFDVNRWGKVDTVGRFIRDSYRWKQGERNNFEGAVLAREFYHERHMN